MMMHRRTTPSVAASSSSKLAASRERRARRKIQNGLHRTNSNVALGYCQRILILSVSLILVILLLVWIGAMFHLSTITTQSDERLSVRDMQKKHILNKPPVRLHDSGENPYTAKALEKNPHLGWQPTLISSPLGSSFSWRTCFKAEAKSDGSDQPAGCRENPNELGDPPAVGKDWIPDVTMVRTMMMYGKDRDGNPFPPPLSKELCENIGVFGGDSGDTNKQCLLESMIRATGPLRSETVSITPSNHYGVDSGVQKGTIDVPAPKLMCLVYTMADAHANRIRAMRDTWAGGCDGFLAFSTKSDPRFPVISLEHEGPESYDNMWQKVRSIWRFVGKNYLEEFDFFFIGGDDLFVMPHNLKTYLASLVYKDGADPETKEYFVGRRFNPGGHDPFNSGGAGYSLSRATLRKFLANMDDNQRCSAKARTSMEDVMIARCLKNLGIHYTDTRDANGR
jgi:glycoprotein-N-acetylgalactosamine 3-beta-galactosyltransferase